MRGKDLQIIEIATADRIQRDMGGNLMSFLVALALVDIAKKILKGE